MGERGLRGRGLPTIAVAAALGLLLVSAVSAASVLPFPVSDDPYTNAGPAHKTQVEPDSFAFGQTIVTTSQSGRNFAGGGASNNVFSTSQDGGAHLGDRRASRARPSTRPRRARGRGSAILRSPTTPSTTSGSLRASRSTRAARVDSVHRQPLHRRRPDVVEPRHGRGSPGHVLGQDLDRLRRLAAEPLLRQLLLAVGRQRARQRDDDEHVDRRRPDVEPRHVAVGAVRARRPARRPAERNGCRAVHRELRRRLAPSARRTAAPAGRARSSSRRARRSTPW